MRGVQIRKQFSPKNIRSLLRWLMMFRREMRDVLKTQALSYAQIDASLTE